MSVINKMLQDLDQRAHGQETAQPQHQVVSQDASRKRRIIIAILLLVLIVALAVSYFYQKQLISGSSNQSFKTIQFDASSGVNSNSVASSAPAVKPVVTEDKPSVLPQQPVSEVTSTEMVDPEPVVLPVLLGAQWLQTTTPDTRQIYQLVFSQPLTQYQLSQTKQGWHLHITQAQFELPQLNTTIAEWQGSGMQWQQQDNDIALTIRPASLDVSLSLDKTRQLLQILFQRTATTAPAAKPVVVTAEKPPQDNAAQRLPAKTTESPQVKPLYWRARDAYNQRDYSRAEQLLLKTLKQQPQHKAAILLMAQVWLEQQDYRKVVFWLERHQAMYQSPETLLQLLARAHIGLSEWALAEQALQRFPAPEHAEWLALMGMVVAKQQRSALPYYQALQQLEPKQAKWTMALAIEFDRQGSYQAALQHYKASLQLEHLSPTAQQFCQGRIQQLMAINGGGR